jgi:hypothetical protein
MNGWTMRQDQRAMGFDHLAMDTHRSLTDIRCEMIDNRRATIRVHRRTMDAHPAAKDIRRQMKHPSR